MKKSDRFSHITALDSGHVPRWQKIGTITSVPVSQDNRFGATGVYEIDIEIDEAALEVDGDKLGYVKHCIAKHLAGCAVNTGIPMNERAWKVQLDGVIRMRFPSLPKEFKA